MSFDDAIPGLTDELLDFTEGKRMVIIGGNWASPDDAKFLKRVLELADLEWVTNDFGAYRATKAACSRILNGKYDIVVAFTRASSHAMYYDTKEAAKKAEIPFFALNKSLTAITLVHLIGEYLEGRNRTPAYARQKA